MLYGRGFMKNTLIALVLIATVTVKAASAEVVPTGCFISDSERYAVGNAFGYTPQCYQAADNYYNWYTHDQYSRSALIILYGQFVEALMFSEYRRVNDCTAAYNTQIDTYNGLVNTYNSLLHSYKKKSSVEKKLRKACGSNCKRIK
jgi:hypothetical protein